jgi:hypothetical protein
LIAELMPGYMPPGASAPVPVPQGTGMQSYPNGEPPYRPGQAVSPDWNGSHAAKHGRWFYREKGWTNGVPDFDMTAPCVISEAE